MTAPADEYRDVLRRLTGLDEEAAALRAEAESWHAGRVAAAAEAVRAAEENVRAAEAEVAAAQRAREDVDARANGLWSDFVHQVGARSAERFGRTLPPAAVPRQRDRDAEEYLRDAAATVAYEPPARSAPAGTALLFAGLGAAGGALGVAGRELLRWAGRAAGGDWATALPVIGLIMLLVGPVLALIAARRLGSLTAANVVTLLVTALVTIGLINLWLT